MDHPQITKLKQKLSEAFDDTKDLTEEQALEAALDVAEGWQMRLDELRSEQE